MGCRIVNEICSQRDDYFEKRKEKPNLDSAAVKIGVCL